MKMKLFSFIYVTVSQRSKSTARCKHRRDTGTSCYGAQRPKGL